MCIRHGCVIGAGRAELAPPFITQHGSQGILCVDMVRMSRVLGSRTALCGKALFQESHEMGSKICHFLTA